MKSCTIITCNNCEFYNTQYCKNCSTKGDDCYEHWEWRHDVSWRQEQIDNLTQKITDLEAKLEESEIRSKESEIFYKREINRRDTKLRNIKQQLAEKDETLIFADKTVKGLILNHNQDKISFCIEQLEKVKEETKEYFYEMLDSEKIILERDFLKVLDNQIKQLKEMK